MPKKPKSLDEKTFWTWERILLVPAFVLPIILMVLTAEFYPDQGGFVPAWEESGLVGLVLMAALSLLAAAVAIGRQNAWKIIAGHRVSEGATSEYYALAPRFAPIDVERLQIDKTLPPKKQAEIRAELSRMSPGRDARGQPVPMGYRWGGGYVYMDGEWTVRGRDFIVLEIGDGKSVQLGKNVLYFTDLYLIDHALLDPEIAKELTEKTRGDFVYNETKVYVTGDSLNSWLREYVSTSQVVRKTVNEAQGFAPVFEALVAELKRAGFDLAKVTREAESALRSAIYDWLSKKGDGFGVEARGWSDGKFAPLYYGEVTKRVRAEQRLEREQSRSDHLQSQLEARAARGAALYTSRTPRRTIPDVQDSMAQIPGIGSEEG